MDYKGYTIQIGIDDKIVCGELQIRADTVVEAKNLIDAFKRSQTKSIKTKVLFLRGAWDVSLTEGVAGAKHGEDTRWITYKVGKSSRREIMREDSLYFDNSKNRKALQRHVAQMHKAESIMKTADLLLEAIPSLAEKSNHA